MRLRDTCILLFSCCILTACAAPAPTWRAKAAALVNGLEQQGVIDFFPQDYNNLMETFEHGEAVLHVKKNKKAADAYYLFTIQKGELLRTELLRKKALKAEEERRLEAERIARAEDERMLREAALALKRLNESEQQKAVATAKAAVPAGAREKAAPLPLVHTVHRGETLPQIAARTEIYNNASLWPIIYRANRDQIRDPKQLWPGQTLKIPRHFSSEEALEAKRYSNKK